MFYLDVTIVLYYLCCINKPSNLRPMQKWKLELDLSVSDNWIADGVNFSDKEFLERFNEHIRCFLGYAHYEVEFKVRSKVSSAPDQKKVLELQGY